MSDLIQWAIRHNVSHAALQELHALFRSVDTAPPVADHKPRSEAAVSAGVVRKASAAGGRLFRNNVGAGKTEEGSFVRWGLANVSKQMNKVIKSADWIGIHPVLITPAHVGHIIGQFDSAECKPEDWTYTGTPREVAQLAWARLIVSFGGRARFINHEDQF